MIIKFIDLSFTGGGSDKVYHCAIEERKDGLFVVPFAYGRRGNTLTRGFKTTVPVNRDKAEDVYEKLIKEKAGKGYIPAPGVSGPVFVSSDVFRTEMPELPEAEEKPKSGILPQLLNPCTEQEVRILVNDPDWGMQEKKDGERRMVRLAKDGTVHFINRKGFIIPETPQIKAAVAALGVPCLLDGEQIGDTLHCFGMLEYRGKSLKNKPYSEVFSTLSIALNGFTGSGLEIVPLARTAEEKLALLESTRVAQSEGIVLKRLDSLYMANRPASGGDYLKFKYWETASCVVVGINDKRSVQLGVLNDSGELINVGNVTIPPNKQIPAVNEIVEIRYLYAYKGGCLFQPQFEGKRNDLYREDCVEKQLKFNGKEE